MITSLPAHAQDFGQAFEPERWLAVEGGVEWLASRDQGDPGSPASQLEDLLERDITGALEFGHRPANGPFDFVGRLRFSTTSAHDGYYEHYSEGLNSPGEIYEFTASQHGKTRETLLVADIEIGRDVGIGSHADGRFHFGFRGAAFEASSAFDLAGGVFYSEAPDDDYLTHEIAIEAEERLKSTFVGAGPRVGLETSVPLRNHNGISLDFGIAGAVLYGRREVVQDGSFHQYVAEKEYLNGVLDNTNVVIDTTTPIAESTSSWGVIYNAEASAALTYALGSDARISTGYRVVAYWNLIGHLDGTVADRFSHGPFAKLVFDLN